MRKRKSNPTIFAGVPQHYRNLMKKKGNWEQMLGIIPSIEKSSHFEIVKDDVNKIIFIEFHTEGEGSEKLQILIKYWEGISVFDKKIQYDIWQGTKGKLYIKCDYSYGEEKICAYIYEFIYQLKNRIENIITLGGLK